MLQTLRGDGFVSQVVGVSGWSHNFPGQEPTTYIAPALRLLSERDTHCANLVVFGSTELVKMEN
jgi:hypothetical protein